jgi:hypothetical protein
LFRSINRNVTNSAQVERETFYRNCNRWPVLVPIFLFLSGFKMFAQSSIDVIPRTRQAVGTKETMITIFFTRR